MNSDNYLDNKWPELVERFVVVVVLVVVEVVVVQIVVVVGNAMMKGKVKGTQQNW